jgi:hypothetical protein
VAKIAKQAIQLLDIQQTAKNWTSILGYDDDEIKKFDFHIPHQVKYFTLP